MRAKNQGEFIILELEGQLDFETTLQFKDACEQILEKKNDQRVIFNLEKLKFVGSSGINQFVQVLKGFNSRDAKPKYCRLSSEFQKVFKAYQTTRNPFEVYEDESQAIVSFTNPPPPPLKKTRKKPAQA